LRVPVVYQFALIAMPALPQFEVSGIEAYLHDRCPEVHSLGSDRAIPDLSELADLLSRSLDVVGVLGDALVKAALRKAHVGIDLVDRHLGAEGPDTEASGHFGWYLRWEWSTGRGVEEWRGISSP
jgi:hypothetical protein